MAISGIDYSCFACADVSEKDLQKCLAEKQVLEQQITNLNTQIANLNTQLLTCGNEKTDLQNQLDTCTTEKTDLQTQIVAIDSKLQTILGRDVGEKTTEEKADLIIVDKGEIETAIEGKKGSALATPNDLSTYATEINHLEAYSSWGRPPKWLKIDNLVDLNNEQKAVMLYFVRDDADYDSIAFSVTASTDNTIKIDWGDGTVDTDVANGVHIHDYNYSSISSPLTVKGYKQCIISVTSTSDITEMNFSNKSNSAGKHSVGFLDGIFSLPNLASAYQMFRDLVETQHITIGDIPNVTDLGLAVYRVYGLRAIEIGEAPNCTNTRALFSGCHSLKSVRVPTTLTTDTTYIIDGCYGLTSISCGEYTNSTTNNRNFSNNINLSSFTLDKYNNDINIKGTNLSKSKLIELFNNLETVTDKTVTITGARGASSLTNADIQIATDKGWTVTN